MELTVLGGIEHSGQKAIDMGAVSLKAGILHIDTAQVSSSSCSGDPTDEVDLWDREGSWTSYYSSGYGQEGRLGDYKA